VRLVKRKREREREIGSDPLSKMDRLVDDVVKIKQSRSHEKLSNFIPKHSRNYFIFSSFFWGGGGGVVVCGGFSQIIAVWFLVPRREKISLC
jgi:hypothetical protein